MRRLIQGFFYNNPDNYPAIINSTRLLQGAGWEVELFCRDDEKDWNIGYPVGSRIARIKVSKKKGSWQEYFAFLSTSLRRGKSDSSFFIGHDMHGLVPARILAALHRRPLIYCCYDYVDDGQALKVGSRLVRSFQSKFASHADLVTVPDAGLGAILKTDLGLRNDPLVVVNSPLVSSREGGGLREALDARQKRFEKIVFRQGRVGPGHGIEATIRSMPHWKSQTWGFVVMGITDSPFVESMQQLAISLGVANRFVVLPPVGYDAVAQFTPDADLGHALYESTHVNNRNIGGACKVQEYLAAGVPLLVSTQPSLKKLMADYKCGIVVDENSPRAIATAITDLLCDPERRASMAASAREAFAGVFCYERQFAPVIERLGSLVAGNGGPSRASDLKATAVIAK